MKFMIGRRRLARNPAAFTRTELVVVIFILLIVGSILMPTSGVNLRHKAKRIACVNNLKQIGIADRAWENDHGNKFPASTAMTNGGWNDFRARTNAGAYCWVYYWIMSKESGLMPSVLTCPADERRPAMNFESLKDNSHLSYFIGVQANDTNPQSVLGGDRNLGPGSVSAPDYGFSPANGMGNDVNITGPVCWSLRMHSSGSTVGAGNILLSEGSIQQTTSASFRKTWQPSAGETTNWPTGHIPSSPSFRVIFP
ncbi:MAG: type II secretion system protein [Limisphaerales bacterium]